MFGFFESPAFDPEKDIPCLDGKTILVTGGNAGLGKEQILMLARHKPLRLYLAARSKAKAEAAISEIESAVPGSKIYFIELDLSSLASVKAASDAFLEQNSRLDILVNNAGIMAHPARLTPDGYEVQFGTNHMGHFLFTRQLLPLLAKTAEQETASPSSDVRIVNLTSQGHKLAPKGGWLPEACKTDMGDYLTWTRYGQSKLANILFTKELARRYPQITSVAIHPGVVRTSLAGVFMDDYPWLNAVYKRIQALATTTPALGALNQTWACVAPLKEDGSSKPGLVSGNYYLPVAALSSGSSYAKDEALAKKLWEWSEAEVLEKGY